MKLVLRRARGAKTLLLAAVAAALISVAFVVGLLDYGRDVVSAASRSTVSSAPPEERSVLVRGAADAGGTSLVAKDAALRRALAGGVGGRPVTVWAAGYSVGRQLSGSVGSAVGDTDGVAVVPRADAAEVLELVRALVRNEERRIAEIQSGQVFKPDIDEALRKKGVIE